MNGFWWLFYYAFSPGNLCVYWETFKHYYTIDEFQLVWMDFGGSFTTLFHLEIFVSTEKLLNITILLMNFS